MHKPELLLPAGNLDTLKTAVIYGADAVYIGGEAFSLRAKADNFGRKEMTEAIAFAHERGARVYITVNIFAHDRDLKEAEQYLHELSEIRPDALIISDLGLFMMAKEICKGIELHISTQMNTTNYEAFNAWFALGASRVVAARELSLSELREIRENIPEDRQIEAFVHGAMCISYSGRCLLSAYMTGRSANLGSCTHPCRWQYSLMENTRPGEYYPVEENERGTYIFNSKDLCMIEHIPELVEAGIDSFKIEGRMKTQLYVATCARTYRRAIDDYLADPALYEKNLPLYREEIGKCTYREFTTGFYFGKPGEDAQVYDAATYVKDYTFFGSVDFTDEEGYAHLMQKNKFCVGDEIEILNPDMTDTKVKVLEIRNEETDELMDSCPHASERLRVKFSEAPKKYDILGGKA